ncbi:MAG: transposase [Devosia sp.]|nr:transposase [Devosia sp.]
MALHRSGQADPERLHRELQRSAAGRTAQRDPVPSLTQVGATVASWRADYNLNRPHSRLGWLTPAEYAGTFKPRRDLALRSMQGSAPAPVAHHGQSGQLNRPSLRHAG